MIKLKENIWIIYPTLLFLLPNRIRIKGLSFVAPESLFLIIYYIFILLIDMTKGFKNIISFIKKAPISIWMFFIIIMLSWSINPMWKKYDIWGHAILWLATFLFAYNCSRIGNNHDKLFKIWEFLAIVVSIYYILNHEKIGEKDVNIMAWEMRTTLGYFIAVPASIYILKIANNKKKNKIIEVVIMLTLITSTLLTFSRGPWLIICLNLIGGSLLLSKRIKKELIACVILLIITTFIIRFYFPDISTRIKSIADKKNYPSSLEYRLTLYNAAFKAIPKVGLLGKGYGSSGRILYNFCPYEYVHLVSETFITDSDIIWLLIETGPIALIIFIFFLIKWGVLCIRSLDNEKNSNLYKNFVLWISVLVMLIFDNIISSSFGWFIIGFGSGYASWIDNVNRQVYSKIREISRNKSDLARFSEVIQ